VTGDAAEEVRPAQSGDRVARLDRAFEIPIFVAALLVIPVVVIEASSASHGWKTFGQTLNWVIWAAFALELIVMLSVAPHRIGWLRAHPLEAAIVVLTPPFLPAALQALRLFRLLRVLRLAVVVRRYKRLFTTDGVRGAAVIALVAALGGGALFATFEKGYSTWDGVWWAAATMTTVGYGDISPHTTGGRIVGIALMLIGIGFVALLTGAIAQRFLSPQLEEGVASIEVEVSHDVGQARSDLLSELRQITKRLQALERRVEQL
jgi:voltage-gated potassium channel